ncbi:autotransporter domain-containing protein [Bordetella muralis]|uniref:autotransporter domain-containing protein n=1 Tax=Bordetella muralis TaxID=1649130 RepID=UPI0039EF12BB
MVFNTVRAQPSSDKLRQKTRVFLDGNNRVVWRVDLDEVSELRLPSFSVPDWPLKGTITPPPVYASDFTGEGVKVGISDFGFDTLRDSPHWLALSGVIHENLPIRKIGDPSVHGAIVARIVAGKPLGDEYAQGIAQGSRLYVTDARTTYKKLFANDVTIINHSWVLTGRGHDGIRELGNADEATLLKRFVGEEEITLHQAVWINDVLMIWGAGNAAASAPSYPGLLPGLLPTLQKGWLVATSIHSDGTLRSYANACGEAANWCISTVEGRAGDYKGTSLAAPVVTATAALVSEAHPWMDNSALRQTLLSTADDLGKPEIYGWGRLNPDRAVRGPALFDSRLTLGGDFIADIPSSAPSSGFYNNIAGDRGLIKKGGGRLALWGENTYTGGTQVLDGILELHGSVAGWLSLSQGAILISNGGRIGGDFVNAGKVYLEGKGLHVQGDYIEMGRTRRVYIPVDAVFEIDGRAYIGDSSLHILSPSQIYISTAARMLMRAGEIIGEFGAVAIDGLYQATVRYGSEQIDVLIDRYNVATAARASFAEGRVLHASALAVETSFAAVDRKLQGESVDVSDAFISQAAILQHIDSTETFEITLNSLTGEVYASSQALSFQQAQIVNRALSNRVDALSRTHDGGGLWINMLGADGKLQQSGYASADTHLFGAQLGADYRLNPHTIIGAAFSWSQANAVFDGPGGRSKGRSVGLSVYGRHGGATGNYLVGRLGHDWIHTDVSRDIMIGQSEHIASNRHDGMTSAYAELGYVLSAGSSTYTPFAGIEYSRLHRGAFHETGSQFGLSARHASYEQGAALFGMRHQSGPMRWTAGETTFTGSAAYRYGNPGSLRFSAAFNGAPDARFTLQGIGLPRHSGWLGFGVVTRQDSSHLDWFINVDMQLDHHGVNSKAISAGLRYEFG